jgi:hypothetical protein
VGFKFEFESKEFKFLKDLYNEKAIFYFLSAMPLPHPTPDQQQPSRQPILDQLATASTQPPIGHTRFAGTDPTR